MGSIMGFTNGDNRRLDSSLHACFCFGQPLAFFTYQSFHVGTYGIYVGPKGL